MGCVGLRAQTADFLFQPTPSTRCAPVQVQCTDISTGGAVSWNWTVSGPDVITPSTDQHPGFTFIIPGDYTLTLSINGGASTHSEVITIFAIPQADFEIRPGYLATGCSPFEVCFDDLTIEGDAPITDWSWDLGEPPLASVQNPCIIYTGKNIFDVELVVTDGNGCQDFLDRNNFVQIFEPPNPTFTIDPASGCDVPLEVTVTNTTFAQPGTSYTWQFPGTGVSPTGSNVEDPGIVTYTENGTYDILLTTDDNGCTKDSIAVDAVAIDLLLADFTISDLTPCEGENVNFVNTSNLPGLNCNWLVDGVPASSNCIYSTSFSTPGPRTITLAVETVDGLCSDSISQIVDIQDGPAVSFSADNTTACGAPFTANFTSTAPDAVSYAWSVTPSAGVSINTSNAANPSITFNNSGNYSVSLMVTSANGCTNTVTQSNLIRINDNVGISISSSADNNEGCVPLDIEFWIDANLPAGVTITGVTWDIPGGTPPNGSGTPISTTYNATGDYTVTADVTFSGGCNSASTSIQVEVGDFPTLTADITPDEICLNEEVLGTGTSNLPNTEFIWYFEPPGGIVNTGFGTTSIAPYNYEDEWQQPWTVLMVGDNNGCKDTVEVEVTVNPPAAQYDWLRSCDPKTEVSFIPNTPLGIFSDDVVWILDGHQNNPIHTATNINNGGFTYDFGTLGVYEVQLVVSSSFTTCTDSVTHVIDLLNSQPNADISPRSLCPGESVSFTDNTIGIDTWQWLYGDGDTSAISTSVNTFVHVYDSSGIYDTYLFTVNNQGCADTLGPVRIYVGGGTADIDGVLGACMPPLSTTLNVNSSVFGFGVDGANWLIETESGPVAIDGPTSIGPFNYTTNGTYSVFVEVFDTIGCTDAANSTINIGDIVADFTADIISICPGQDITFTNLSLGGNLEYLWDFGDGNGSMDENPVHNFPTTGQFTVTLTATDTIQGCSDIETKPLYINAIGTGFDFTSTLPRTANCPPLFVEFAMVPPTDPSSLDYVHWYFEESNETSFQGDELTGFTNGQNFYLQGGPDGNGWYDVILVVEVGGCRDSIYKDDYIFVGGQRGTFTFTPDTICAPDDVLFSQINVDRTDTIFWDFGGGAVLNAGVNIDNIPVRYDEPGVYEPVILLKNANCPPVAALWTPVKSYMLVTLSPMALSIKPFFVMEGTLCSRIRV